MTSTKKAIICAIMISMCTILPQAFHTIPDAGSIYCPMHIPVLLCALITGPSYGLLTGLLGPLFSSLFTSMPSFAYLLQMMVELGAYGLFAGLFMQYLPIKNEKLKLYMALMLAMLLGRIISGISKALVFARGLYSLTIWTSTLFIKSFPGIIIQLIIIPIIYIALKKAKLI